MINVFHSRITKARRDPIRTVEVCGICLYFTSHDSWLTKYRHGRRDAKVVWDTQFEQLLDIWEKEA
jgi:hypothetical protein